MKTEHVPFEKMSDLHDNLIDTTEEKESIIEHFNECTHCSDENQRLKQTICHLEAFRDCDFCLTDITGVTLKKYAWRQRKHRLYRALPAVAASFILITGAGLFSSGLFNNTLDNNGIQGSMVSSSMMGNDTAKIVKIIGDHKAKILRVSDLFIEGEIPRKDFNRLRRDLGFRKVVYNVTRRNVARASESALNQNFKAVGVNSGNGMTSQPYREPGNGDLYVRFRVFK